MRKKYIVGLREEEKTQLQQLLSTGRHSAKKLRKARVLLKSDMGWKDKEIAADVGLSVQQIEKMRAYFVEEGMEKFLAGRYSQREYPRKIAGKQEAQLVAIACSAPPEGSGRWTLQLLATRMVELNYVESVSHTTIGKVLKKTKLSRG